MKKLGLSRALETLNKMLEENEFICGDSVSLVDILFYCDLITVTILCCDSDFRMEKKFTNVYTWMTHRLPNKYEILKE